MRQVAAADVLTVEDRQILGEVVIRVAGRILEMTNRELNVVVANPVAIEVIRGHLFDLVTSICQREGISMEQKPDGTIVIHLQTRH